jgi:hypothetical protein
MARTNTYGSFFGMLADGMFEVQGQTIIFRLKGKRTGGSIQVRLSKDELKNLLAEIQVANGELAEPTYME